MLTRDAAADGGMGRIEEENFHRFPGLAVSVFVGLVQSRPGAQTRFTLYHKVYDASDPSFVQIVIEQAPRCTE
jgi:hypothetical protein